MRADQREINMAGEEVQVPPQSAAMNVRPHKKNILVQQENSRKSLDEGERDIITANE